MTEELTLRVSDLERKAIVFCREKDIPFPIANYLVAFVTEVTKKSGEQLTKAKEIIKKFLLWENAWHNKTESKYEILKQAEQFLKELEND